MDSPSEAAALAAVEVQLSEGLPLRGHRVLLALSDTCPVGHSAEGTSVGLKATTLVDGRQSEGSISLLRPGALEDPRCPAFVAGWLGALRRIVEDGTAQSLERFSVGALDVRMPLEAPSAQKAGYTAALLEQRWLGSLLPEHQRTPVNEVYEKAPLSAVSRGGTLDLVDLQLWVSRHASPGFRDLRADRAALAALPPAPRTLWHLFWADNEIHHNGLASLLLQCPGHLIAGSIAAFDAVGAASLAALVRRGVPVAARSGAEFCLEPDRAWRSGLPFDSTLATLDDLDGHEPGRSFFLLKEELQPKLRAYVEAHRADLVSDPRARTGVTIRRRAR